MLEPPNLKATDALSLEKVQKKSTGSMYVHLTKKTLECHFVTNREDAPSLGKVQKKSTASMYVHSTKKTLECHSVTNREEQC